MKKVAINKIPGLPKYIIGIILIISIVPFFLQFFGIDFGISEAIIIPEDLRSLTGKETNDLALQSLKGYLIHFVLEWSAVAIAIATGILAFIQYKATGNPATPVIGMALLSAGIMDIFHGLAAVELIQSNVQDDNFTPFTWVLSRIFNALILFTGVIMIFYQQRNARNLQRQNRSILFISLFFILSAIISIYICLSSATMPITMFPDKILTRPYDVIPLILYLVLGVWLLPLFHRKENNVFSHALIWSMVPAIATQIHMVFGSDQLFDSDFNIAHFLKAFSYTIPLAGLAVDYVTLYSREKSRIAQLRQANTDIAKKNKELSQFVYVASHDLQEPLRTITSFTEFLSKNYRHNFDEVGRNSMQFITDSTGRMSNLIKGLLDYSRLGFNTKVERVNCNSLVESVKQDLSALIKSTDSIVEVDGLPSINAYNIELHLLFQNLIHNAIKFRKPDSKPHIKIWAKPVQEGWHFSVKDNGIGIDSKFKEKIFLIFQRLHNRDKYEGTGIGLAHCVKIVELHNGKIWVDSEPDKGSTFHFSLLKLNEA